MLSQILDDCKNQLSIAVKNKKHPFRLFTLSTQKKDRGSQMRTVVIRDFNQDNLHFTIYTDARSNKVEQLNLYNQAQFLFYDSTRLVQLIFETELISIEEDNYIYESLPEKMKKDYTSIKPPGSKLKAPNVIKYDFSRVYFRKITFQSLSMEYLKLKRPNHLRVHFSKSDQWKGCFLTP